jgi:hypothetical protein
MPHYQIMASAARVSSADLPENEVRAAIQVRSESLPSMPGDAPTIVPTRLHEWKCSALPGRMESCRLDQFPIALPGAIAYAIAVGTASRVRKRGFDRNVSDPRFGGSWQADAR